jgi:glycosyltransferase involved in cell wall biosynthesis
MRAAFAIPGDLATPTGGYAYARALLLAAPAAGLTLAHLALPGGFPHPDAAALAETARALAGVPGPVLVDGLALGAMPQAVVRAARGPVVALCHHPLWLEGGIDPATAERLRESEAAALALCAAVIVPSPATARDVADLGVPGDRITIAPPGLDRADAAPRAGTPPVILSVGSLTPRKGHDTLIAALGLLADRPWTCVIAGADDRDPAWAATLRDRAAALPGRVRIIGAVDRDALDALYAGADIFCLPSRHEGYGMVFAEAMMRGLPIVAARAGAVPEVVPQAAGLLVPPGDAAALAGALARLLDDPEAARATAAAGRAHALTLPGWTDTAAKIAGVLRRVAR